jgi:hypothetical protein
MGFDVSTDGGRDRLLIVADGVITANAIRDHLDRERADGALGSPELIDARGATPDVSTAEVRDLVGVLAGLARGGALGPTAVVVATDHAYGMLRMLEILADGVAEVRPFRDIGDAERWLQAAALARDERPQ